MLQCHSCHLYHNTALLYTVATPNPIRHRRPNKATHKIVKKYWNPARPNVAFGNQAGWDSATGKNVNTALGASLQSLNSAWHVP